MKKYIYSSEKLTPFKAKKNYKCAICDSYIETTKTGIKAECGDVFHERCLLESLDAGEYNCPLCSIDFMIDTKKLNESQADIELK